MRRRVALLTGVHLNLPSSPVVGPSPPGSSRETAYTFTAEWDSTQDEFVFSDLDSAGASSSSSSASARRSRFAASPFPFDVSEDEADFALLSPPPTGGLPVSAPPLSISLAPHLHDMVPASSALSSPSSSPSSSSSSSPASPAVSDIFDLYTSTPNVTSFAARGGPSSDGDDDDYSASDRASTAPSSPLDTPSPTMASPPSYKDARFDPPVISVTFFQADTAGPHGVVSSTAARFELGPVSAVELPSSWGARLSEKARAYAQAPYSAGPVPSRPSTSSGSGARRSRPLPPVPVRPAAPATPGADVVRR